MPWRGVYPHYSRNEVRHFKLYLNYHRYNCEEGRLRKPAGREGKLDEEGLSKLPRLDGGTVEPAGALPQTSLLMRSPQKPTLMRFQLQTILATPLVLLKCHSYDEQVNTKR